MHPNSPPSPPPLAEGIGHAKLILLGEHAVVYGYAALAGALPCGVTCRVYPGRGRTRIAAWQVEVNYHDAHPVAAARRAIATALSCDDQQLDCELQATIPAGAGVGSSAAFAVALARALATALPSAAATATAATATTGVPQALVPTAPLARIVAAANAAESVFHAQPSGIDVALAYHGGLATFTRRDGYVACTAPPLAVVVGFSGEARRTKDMVMRVAQVTAGNADDARLRTLGALALAGTEALRLGDHALLGQHFNHAHAVLAQLTVSTPRLDAMCTAARQAGAWGAKLTGAGGGGAMVAIGPDPAALADALGALDAGVVTATLGQP